MALFFCPQFFFYDRTFIKQNALVKSGLDFHIEDSWCRCFCVGQLFPSGGFDLQNCQAAEQSSGLFFANGTIKICSSS
ncbi:hypothetical protein DSM25559_0498 [Agrobacterium rosae]|uniref:Uncharacterized protein n=1 Tax=Agrobacterium rosae TaxID=1972867 RepID=A0A1R3THL5_9HYPH|nr:hypothetical protein DSM25559_0498 [Agrobacterium rosae]